MESWRDYAGRIEAALNGLSVTDEDSRPVAVDEAFARWVGIARGAHDSRNTIFIVGNGGSAMIAGHFAADLCKNARVRALALNDVALLTASANDLAFAEVFAIPLAQLGREGDLLITVSSSGNSPNVLRAIETARAEGMKVVTLSGKGSDNRSRTLGDLNFYVAADRYGFVESAHHIVMHHWLDQYLIAYCGGAL